MRSAPAPAGEDRAMDVLRAPPGAEAYQSSIPEVSVQRIAGLCRRLCLDGSNRQPKFIIPSIADQLKAGGSVAGLALESALWCRYCYGETESGKSIEPNDPSWERLARVAKAAKNDPAAWLKMEDIYGNVGVAPDFSRRFSAMLKDLWSDGVERVVARYLDGEGEE